MHLERVDELFRAFSDRTRLRILNVLRDGELCVGDLVQILGVPQPTASRHLAQLRDAGLVTTRRQGLWCFYALAKPGGRFHARLIGCLASCFEEVPELAADLTTAKELRLHGGCCPETARKAASPGVGPTSRTAASSSAPRRRRRR